MEKICDKVLRKIKDEKICPKPRWHFLLKDYIIWSLFLISVFVGAVSSGVIIFVFLSNDWDLYKYLQMNPFEHFIFSLPYLWIILLAVFLVLAIYNYRNTPGGYRFETYVVLAASVLTSVLLGFLFHFEFGLGEKIDKALSKNIPVYARIHAYCNRENIWSQPEKGLLAGEIREIFEDNRFELEDFHGSFWDVEKDEKLVMPVGFMIMTGRKVKLIGEKRTERIFWAREIRFWDR